MFQGPSGLWGCLSLLKKKTLCKRWKWKQQLLAGVVPAGKEQQLSHTWMAQQGQHLRVLVATGLNKKNTCRVSLPQSSSCRPHHLCFCTCSTQPSFFPSFFFLMQRKYFNHKPCLHLPRWKPALIFLQTSQSSNHRLPTQHWHGNSAPSCPRAGELGDPAGTTAEPSPSTLQGLWGPPAATWAHKEGPQEHKCCSSSKRQWLITQLYAVGVEMKSLLLATSLFSDN